MTKIVLTSVPPMGSRVKDAMTKYQGIVVARTELMNGSWRVLVQAEEMMNGLPAPPQVFDAWQMIVISEEPNLMAEARTQAKAATAGSSQNQGNQ